MKGCKLKSCLFAAADDLFVGEAGPKVSQTGTVKWCMVVVEKPHNLCAKAQYEKRKAEELSEEAKQKAQMATGQQAAKR